MADQITEEIGADENHPLADLLELFAELICTYNERHYPVPPATEVELPRFLMGNHGPT